MVQKKRPKVDKDKIMIGKIEVDKSDIASYIQANPNLVLYLEHLVEYHDGIDVTNPNSNYVGQGMRKAYKKLLNMKTKEQQ